MPENDEIVSGDVGGAEVNMRRLHLIPAGSSAGSSLGSGQTDQMSEVLRKFVEYPEEQEVNEYERASSGSDVYFKQMMRFFGRAFYGLVNEVSDVTKEGVQAVFHYDQPKIEACEIKLAELLAKFRDARLSNLMKPEEFQNLAVILHEDFDSPLPEFKQVLAYHMVGQEISEFKIVKTAWPHVDRGEDLDFIPTAVDLRVSPPMWFGGLVDAVSELAKLMTLRLEDGLSLEDQIRYVRRFLENGRKMVKCLEAHAHIPGYIIDNSTYRFQHFRDGLRRVHQLLGRISSDKLGDLLAKNAQNDDMEARIRRLIG